MEAALNISRNWKTHTLVGEEIKVGATAPLGAATYTPKLVTEAKKTILRNLKKH